MASHPFHFISNSLSDSAERGIIRLRNLLLESFPLPFLSSCFTLCLYLFVVIARRRPQPHPILPGYYLALPGIGLRRRLSRPSLPLWRLALTLTSPDSLVLNSTIRASRAAPRETAADMSGTTPSAISSYASAFDTVWRKDRRLSAIHIGYSPYRKPRCRLNY
jgi:hypothetical protein